MLDLSKSDEETKSSILDGLRIDFQQILISEWTIPLKSLHPLNTVSNNAHHIHILYESCSSYMCIAFTGGTRYKSAPTLSITR